MGDHKFNQPIFGANYLSGLAIPSATDVSAALLGGKPARFSLTFNDGGCGTFVGIFYKLLAELDKESGTVRRAAEDGSLNSVAYVDPSDPSTLYLSQPAPAPGTEEDTKFEVTYEKNEPAEVKIIEGIGQGNWVKCIILGPGSKPDTYNIHLLPTTAFNS